jgi:hypothetical protein
VCIGNRYAGAWLLPICALLLATAQAQSQGLNCVIA